MFLARTGRPWSRPVSVSFALGGVLLLPACRVAPPPVAPEADIAAATGLDEAVSFTTEGRPLDESPAVAATLTLAEAVRRAVATDPALQAALAAVRAAQAEAELAGLPPNPILDVVVRFPEGGGKAVLEAGLGADLLAILQRPQRAGAAGHRLQAESARALSAALDVVADVQLAYSQAQWLEGLIAVLDSRLALLDRLSEVARARLDVGEGSRHDVTALDAERTELQIEADGRRRELHLARLGLAKRIGEPSSPAAWRLDAWSAPQAVPTGEQPWIDAALAARPEILAIEWELRAREADEALARGLAYDDARLGIEAERDPDWSIGPALAVPLPLFDAGRLRGDRAEALTTEQRHRLTEAQRAIVEEARSALASLVGAQIDLERVVAELVPLQERRRAEVDAAYRLGAVDVTALLIADQALQATLALRIELEQQTSAALYRLQRAVGGPSAFTAVLAAGQEIRP